jgi:uncharacterized membrane protein YeaQ/YmgE (transglycosylase-associated protein family)
MSIIWVMLTGLIVGAIAKLLMPGKDPGGIVVTMLLGIAGSVVAYLIGRAAGWYVSYSEGPGIIASIIGAVVLLAVYRWAISRRRVV